MDATGLPPRPSPPSNVATQEPGGSTNVGDNSPAAPLVQKPPKDGSPALTARRADDVVGDRTHDVVAASTIRALPDDDPPIPVRQVLDHEKETEGNAADGPQLHDGPTGPPRFPHEFDDSLTKRVENDSEGLQLHDGPASPPCFPHEFDDSLTKRVENDSEGLQLHDGPPGPPCFPHEFDDSLAKRGGNELGRNLSGRSVVNAPTVNSTMESSVANAAAAVGGQSMVEDVEEGNVSSRGTAPPINSRMEEGAATAAVGRNAPPARRSTFIRIAGAWVPPGRRTILVPYDAAELAEPETVLPFYQRKTFVSDMSCALIVIGIAVAMWPLLSNILKPTNIPNNLPTGPLVLTLGTSQKLLAPDGAAAGDRFGESIAFFGDTIVVGAPGDDDNGDRSGSAHVFVRSGEDWMHQAKLLAPDGAANDRFGESVAINENTIVVGAPWDDDNGEDSGSAHVFARSGESWAHQAKLLAPDGANRDQFGEIVALSDDTIVGGACGSYIFFVRSDGEWTYQAKLLVPDGAAHNQFDATSVASDELILTDSGVLAGTVDGYQLKVEPMSVDETIHYKIPGGATASAPTGESDNFYDSAAMCPTSSELISSYADGSGSYGALFDVVALDDVTLRGIGLNVDWHTGEEADVVVYARRGSWFGMQNKEKEWTHLLANTTLSRPDDFQGGRTMTDKLRSAMVPREEFLPLAMGAGETWGLYVCMSNADLRYTVGTNVGSTVSASPQLRILEGAGAANYPPFKSGTPEGGDIDYTFYAPRIFNGRLHYDHVQECPSEEPSAAPSAVPTVSPWVTTRVSYAFYVEHDPDQSGELVVYDMTDGTRKVLAKLVSGMDPVLTGYAEDDNLKVNSVETRVITPREIGYICIPTPPQECLPVSVDVEVRHDKTISTNDVTFALLKTLPRLISEEVTGSKDIKDIEYVVNRADEAVTTRVSGEIIAIYQDTIVVGDCHPKNSISSGSAHVFVRRGRVWTHQAKLQAPDGTTLDMFGKSVAIYQDTIVVGAAGDRGDNRIFSGSAHVFVRSGEEWSHHAKLLAPDGAAHDKFGSSVAIYGNMIVVGSPWDDDNGYNSGLGHVFVRNGEEWSHKNKRLAPDGAAAGDWFGKSIAIYQDTIVVGANGDDDNGDSGSAYVFLVR